MARRKSVEYEVVFSSDDAMDPERKEVQTVQATDARAAIRKATKELVEDGGYPREGLVFYSVEPTGR